MAHIDNVDAEHIDTQNSIYGVGSLLKCDEDDNRPIVCITLFKRKYATLSVARLVRMEGQSEDVVGKVSLKYVASPSPIDLKVLFHGSCTRSNLHPVLKPQCARQECNLRSKCMRV